MWSHARKKPFGTRELSPKLPVFSTHHPKSEITSKDKDTTVALLFPKPCWQCFLCLLQSHAKYLQLRRLSFSIKDFFLVGLIVQQRMSKTLLSFQSWIAKLRDNLLYLKTSHLPIQVVYLILFLWNNVFAKVDIGAHSAFWTIINRYWFWSVKTLKEKMPMITCHLENRKRTPRCLKTCFNSFTWQNSGFCTITRKVNYQRSCTFVPESQREQ